MKLTKMVLFCLVFSTSVWASSLEVKVSGLVCNLCAQGITKTFKSQKEVKNVNVDMDRMIVTLEFLEGAVLSESKITELIEDSGYSVNGFQTK